MNRTASFITSLIPCVAFSSFAHAEIVQVRYDFPNVAMIAIDWFAFGDSDGPINGDIISTTVVIDNYFVQAPDDGSDFLFTFHVPVIGAPSDIIRVTGSSLGWSGTGSFSHAFTSTEFNGQIHQFGFGAEFLGGGQFVGNSYIEFTVDTNPVPAPGSAVLLIGAGLMASRRRR